MDIRLLLGCSLVCGFMSACQTASMPEQNAQASEPSTQVGSVRADVSSSLRTAELMVRGTNCAGCSFSIRKELKKLSGIQEIRGGAEKTHLLVDFEPEQVSSEQIIAAVHEAGYEAEVLVRAANPTAKPSKCGSSAC